MINDIGNLIESDNLIDNWELPLAKFVYEYIINDSTGHDIYHCLRVKQLAIRIAREEGLDKAIMVASAYLHDVGRPLEQQGKGNHVEIGMAKAADILPTIKFPDNKISGVIQSIKYHEEYVTNPDIPPDFKGEILGFQDADRLDAMGAIGIARVFTFGGAYGRPVWFPKNRPSTWSHGQLTESSYNHIYEKLLKLKDLMNTTTGKELATGRHKFLHRFSVQFEKEWNGEI